MRPLHTLIATKKWELASVKTNQQLEQIQWRAIAIPTLSKNLMVIDPLTPSQGHQFDRRLKFFSVSWSTAHPP